MITWAVLPVMMALGAHRDKRRVICNDGRVFDLDAQARGAVGCAHNIGYATQKRQYLLSEHVVLRMPSVGPRY